VTNRRNEAVFRAAFLSRLPQTTNDENNITQDFNSFSYKIQKKKNKKDTYSNQY